MEWGEVLRVSQRGMWASRGFLWEEAARNVACLLACPAAWDGDHFLQVKRSWVTRYLFMSSGRLSNLQTQLSHVEDDDNSIFCMQMAC